MRIEVPPVEEVRPGVWAIPIPMPGSLVYVCTYLVETDDGPLLIDAGWDGEAPLAALEAGVRTAGYSLADLQGVLFTHGHPDHYGLVRRLRERTGAWFALHEADVAHGAVSDAYRSNGDHLARALDGFGCTPEEREAIVSGMPKLSVRGDFPRPDRFIGDADVFAVSGGELLAVHTPGHAPGHVCFVHRGAGVVFTGDHVLSLTTPHIPASPASAESPLDDYLDSLRRIIAHGELLGLPAHEGPVHVGTRAQELLEHHDARLAEALAALADGELTIREVAERMTWSMPFATYGPLDVMLAMSEALAHLLHLRRRGLVARSDGKPYRWRLA